VGAGVNLMNDLKQTREREREEVVTPGGAAA
jgi:hypothetical protein